MPSVEQQQPIFQFGVFEFNPRTGELRKHGVRLKLQDQPLRILVLLVEQAGEVVTREEIQKRLWPDGTYVDFENAINNVIRKLRDALSDSSENPRFIETLARRGYRFIAPVSQLTAVPYSLHEKPPSLPSQTTPPPKPTKKLHLRLVIIVASVCLLAAGIGVRYWKVNQAGTIETSEVPIPLTSYPGFQHSPTFSPEGTRVAFAWDEPGKRGSSIYMKLIGTSEPIRLTNGNKDDLAPAWSPDGRSIAFLRSIGPFQSAVIIIPAVGGPERELTRLQFDATQTLAHWAWISPMPYLAWSPDGKWLLSLNQSSPEHAAEIVRISVETGEKRFLPALPDANASVPSSPPIADGAGAVAVSPDGRRLAFTYTINPPISAVYLVELSEQMLLSGRPARLNFDGSAVGEIAWDPDGRSLVVSSNRRGVFELWKIPITPPGEPVRLHAGGDDPRHVVLSATGQHLVYSHLSFDWNIWRLSLARTHPQQASAFIASTRNDSRPAYSLDGTRIAFESSRSGNEEIWTSDADGSRTVQITSFGKAWAGSPAWSPDGKQIAFDCNASGNWDIYLVAAGGGKPVRLTTDPAAEIRPNWSHDGKWIYYCSARGGYPQIWKKAPTGGDEIQVTKNGGCEAVEAADGKTLYYLKDDTVICRVAAKGGDETKILDLKSGSIAQFSLARGGLYFVDSSDAPILKFLSFRTHSVKRVAEFSGPMTSGLAVSPDEQWLLYGKRDSGGSQLMLLEKFQP